MPILPSDQVWRAIQFSVSSPSAGSCVERPEHALGFVAPAHVLHHHGVAVLHEGLVIRRDVGALAVWRAHQDGRHAAAVRPAEKRWRRAARRRAWESRHVQAAGRPASAAADAAAAQQARIRHEQLAQQFPVTPADLLHPMARLNVPGPPLADGARPPQSSMLAESCAAAAIRVPPTPARSAGRRLRESARTRGESVTSTGLPMPISRMAMPEVSPAAG